MDSQKAIYSGKPRANSAGEEGGLNELYRVHATTALKLAYLLTGNREDAQDLVQDAFVRVTTRLHDIRNRDAFGAYLNRTVVNLANSHFRRKRTERHYVELEKHRDPLMSSAAINIAERLDLRYMLFRLPIRQRTAIVLRYFEDMSEEQTADFMGCSAGAVKSLVLRGMTALRSSGGAAT